MALVKQMWADIGVETEIRNIDGAVFFGADPASPDSYSKFYADVQMYTISSGTDPEHFLGQFTCDGMPGRANPWLDTNVPRECDPGFDEMVAELSVTPPGPERYELARRMNVHLVGTRFMLPIIQRASVSAHPCVCMTLSGACYDA